MKLDELKTIVSKSVVMDQIHDKIKRSALDGQWGADFSETEITKLQIDRLREEGYTVEYNRFTESYTVVGW